MVKREDCLYRESGCAAMETRDHDEPQGRHRHRPEAPPEASPEAMTLGSIRSDPWWTLKTLKRRP